MICAGYNSCHRNRRHLVMPPLSVTGEVYCFPRRQLISALAGVSYINRKTYTVRICIHK